MDYTKLSDEEFEQHRVALMAELERRNNLHDIPLQIQQLAQNYENLGGDKEVMVARLEDGIARGKAEKEDKPAKDKDDETLASVDESGTIQGGKTNKETNENGTTKGPTSS